MEPEEKGEITQLLERWRGGDSTAFETMVQLVYEQLYRIAAGLMRRERGEHTLQPTALLNEVYMRLVRQKKADWTDRQHFYTFAAMQMRNILTDYARAAKRRGGSEWIKMELSDDIAFIGSEAEQVLDLNSALERLQEFDSRKAHIVEMRYFLSFTTEETAEALEISPATAERDLKFARSWLYRELTGAKGGA
ncbi:MAG: ECF-type sigma factor [Terracidiphilus sp.]|nr:ECF-type sigma factor [Terracidiphilus sp.]